MARKQFNRITFLEPFQRFIHIEASSGIMLFAATVLALLWANSRFLDIYTYITDWELSVQFGNIFKLSKPILLWINDGLMAIFFFVVGLEIKREVLVGELSSLRKAMLPIFAAIGGMVMPALLFIILQGDKPGSEGWGIPMATDIAFSLGVLSLLGKRVPIALKVFLTAFAIADDIGAVLVIALFYNGQIDWQMLLIALLLFAVLYLVLRAGMRNLIVFLIFGAFIWYYFLKSGLHPTIAGVMLAFIVPANRRVRVPVFHRAMKGNLEAFEVGGREKSLLLNKEQLAAVDNMEDWLDYVQSPLQRLEYEMHGLVSYLIMPVFALANAGIIIGGGTGPAIGYLSVNLGLSLILGKLLGILLLSWIAIKMGWAALPEGSNWKQMAGIGMLGGIGFTMSIFISSLAYGDPGILNQAKIGILLGSLFAGVAGYLILRATLKKASEI